MNYVTRFDHDNIAHCLRLEILPLGKIDPSELIKSKIHIVDDKIDRRKLRQKWRAFVLSSIFRQVVYISADEVDRIANPISLKTSFVEWVFETMDRADWHVFQILTKRSSRMRQFVNQRYRGYKHHDFIDYPPKAEYIRLCEFIKENAGIKVPEQDYVLLSQRPEGNRYLMESNSGLPLEEYLRHALGKRGIPFRSCDFSTMTPTGQAQLCRGAKIFISAHGAGCVNIIFTPLHCHVLEYNFRKYWNCDPICDLHFHGVLADHEECDSELTKQPYFHKADFHNLCRLLDRPYTELEVDRYDGFIGRNPIGRKYLFVDGASLLAEIENIWHGRRPVPQNIQYWNSK